MIKLIILGQTMSIVTSKVVAGTHRYLEVEGDFKGDDWEGFRKWVHFQDPGKTVHYVLPMYDDRITAEQMLDLTAGTWDVHVHGNLPTDDDDLVRIETEPRQLFVEGDETGNPFPPLTPSFEEILANRVEDAVGIAQSVRDDADAGEFDGATYLPSVSDEGDISWTNDKGKENPETKNIKGPKGDTGESGVYIGTTEPTDPDKDVWINPEGGIGRVITSIETSGTHQPGTYDTYTLHFNEGEDLVLSVYNGADGSGIGDMLKAAYDPQNKATDIFEYADDAAETAAAGKANTADLADVAFSGDYADLDNRPTIPAVDAAMSDNSTNPVQNKVISAALATKANSGSLAAVATSGSYNDLTNKPTIPPGVTVDSTLSSTSTNPVQNKVIKQALDQKQNTLTIDSAMSSSSTNPVQNKAIKQYVDSANNMFKCTYGVTTYAQIQSALNAGKTPYLFYSTSVIAMFDSSSFDGYSFYAFQKVSPQYSNGLMTLRIFNVNSGNVWSETTKDLVTNGAQTGSELVVENFNFTIPSINAGSSNNVVVDIAKQGYTPIGIVTVKPLIAYYLAITGFQFSPDSGLAEVWFRNVTQATVDSNSGFMKVLYQKN